MECVFDGKKYFSGIGIEPEPLKNNPMQWRYPLSYTVISREQPVIRQFLLLLYNFYLPTDIFYK